MIKRTLGSIVVAGFLIGAGAVQAHHSLSGTYDIKQEGKVTGVLTKVAFTNPHGAMTIDVTNADGTVTSWIMTTGSANTLANLGFGKSGPNTVRPGDKVTITYFAARNGKPLGFIRSITLPDQREVQISNGSSTD
jgi:DNA/RNA endonuclease YhcR with UshA esterase domain